MAWQGNTALQLAIYYEDIVKLLLESGEGEARMRMLTRRDIIGQNCFHRAFACNAVDSLRRLIQADRETGSRLMAEQDVDGFGVLHHAAFGGNDEVIRIVQQDFLAEAAPSEECAGQQLLMQRDSFGRTSLHLAASRGYFEVVLALLSMHGDMDGPLIDSLDDNNFSVLHHASAHACSKCPGCSCMPRCEMFERIYCLGRHTLDHLPEHGRMSADAKSCLAGGLCGIGEYGRSAAAGRARKKAGVAQGQVWSHCITSSEWLRTQFCGEHAAAGG